MVRWLVLVAALAGCDNVFGLNELGPGDAATSDAATQTVTGTRVRTFIFNDATGRPTAATAPYATGELTVEASLRDGTPVPVTLTDPGSFQFVVPAGAVYTVAFATPGAIVREIESTATTLAVPDTRYGHPGGAVAGAGTKLELDNIPGTPAPLVVASTGVWSQRAAPAPVAGTSTVDWSGTELVDGTRGDRVLLVDQATVGNYTAVTHAMSANPTMTSGATAKVDASAMAAVSLSACKHLSVDPSVTARGMRSDYPMSSAYWQLFAEPLPQYGINAALAIAVGNAPGAVDVHYANVYPGVSTIAAAIARTNRPVSAPDPTGTTLTAVVGREVVVADDASCNVPDLAMQIGVPGTISVQGVSLSGDHASVTAAPGAARIAVTWDMLVPGPVDEYEVQLYELPAGTGTVTVRRFITTADQQIVLDPAIFDAGREYFILVDALRGMPSAGVGDFTMFAGFREFAWVSSPTFTVAH